MLYIIFGLLSINNVLSAPIDGCDDQAACLDIDYSWNIYDELPTVDVCITYDSRFDGCIKGGDPDTNEDGEAISHMCYNSVEEDKLDGDELGSTDSGTIMCINALCDTPDEERFVEFGFKDGRGCKVGGSTNEGDWYTVSGVEDNIHCRAASIEDSDVLCGGGNHGECIWKIPFDQCPEPTPAPISGCTGEGSEDLECLYTECLNDNEDNVDYCDCMKISWAETHDDDQTLRKCECTIHLMASDKGWDAEEGICACQSSCASGDCDSAGGNPCHGMGVCCCSPEKEDTADVTVCPFENRHIIFNNKYSSGKYVDYTVDEGVCETEIDPTCGGEEGESGLSTANSKNANKNVFGVENASTAETLTTCFIAIAIVAGIIFIGCGIFYYFSKMNNKLKNEINLSKTVNGKSETLNTVNPTETNQIANR